MNDKKEGDVMTPIDERLDSHDKRLQNHSERIQQLEMWDKDKHERLKIVEANDLQHEQRLRDVEQNYTKLENTILNENRETRTFFQRNMDRQWELIKSRDDKKHDVKMAKHEIEKTKIERWSDIFFKLAGTGGILYIIIQALLKI